MSYDEFYNALATIWWVVIWALVLIFIGWVAWKIDRFGLKQMRGRHEREVEEAMRAGIAQAELEDRIAQKIMNERRQ